MTAASILWRGLYWPGHEACRISALDSGWQLAGAAVFAHEGQPFPLNCRVAADAAWRTRSASVSGRVGHTPLAVVSDQDWRLNGVEQPAVAGSIDLDLNFSPCTNLLPIGCLNLSVEQAAEVRAAPSASSRTARRRQP